MVLAKRILRADFFDSQILYTIIPYALTEGESKVKCAQHLEPRI